MMAGNLIMMCDGVRCVQRRDHKALSRLSPLKKIMRCRQIFIVCSVTFQALSVLASNKHEGIISSAIKTPSPTGDGNVFGLYERNGRAVGQFEVPKSSDSDVQQLPLELASQGSLKKRYVSHMKASVLTALLFGLLIKDGLFRQSIDAFDLQGHHIAMICTIALYFAESITCSTRRYLSNALTPIQLKEVLKALSESPPVVTWNIVCYHYRTVHYRMGARTQRLGHSSRQRVVTHKASQQYQFQR
jgi:hypothetical protein